MHLLERDLQLATLHAYADDARRGDGRLVLVSGEAGIGKSSLVEAFVDGLGPRDDARVAWSACDGAFTPSALGPLQDVADQWGGAVRVACAEGVPRDTRFAALLADLREHGEHGGLSVLVVEDLHFADEATLDLVCHLSRRLRAIRALVVATYRDDGLAENRALRETLGEASSQRSTRRIALPPLTAAAVVTLSDGTGHEPAAVQALTAGNPFFVSEVLRALPGELPASARDAVLARVARLSPAGRDVIEAAALIGDRVEPELLRVVTAADTSALDEPIAAGLLVADGTVLRFRHEIARQAVEQEVGPHRAAVVHGIVLARLEAAGVADDARLAHHAEGALDAAAAVTPRPPGRRPVRAAGLAARGRRAVPARPALRVRRPAAAAGRAPRQARRRTGLARRVVGSDRIPRGVHRAVARGGGAGPRGRRPPAAELRPVAYLPRTRGPGRCRRRPRRPRAPRHVARAGVGPGHLREQRDAAGGLRGVPGPRAGAPSTWPSSWGSTTSAATPSTPWRSWPPGPGTSGTRCCTSP